MAVKLKPTAEQVVVVMGAASGIGRETALRFAEAGAKVVVAARDEEALKSLVAEIERKGGEAIHAVCDVAEFGQVEAVAKLARERFGRVDTWVNNAAVSVYGKFWEIAPEEFRRIMDVNYMGQINGSLAALPLLRHGGGALIAISSVESKVSLPLHSAYAASKHAVEGAMDALRREIMAEGWPISVTSVKPATIDTPLFPNSRNKLDVKPKGPPPYYDPDVVADCILYAAEHPVRDMFAGGAARMMVANQHMAPNLLDKALARFGISASQTDQRTGGDDGNLDVPSGDSRPSGGLPRDGRRFSLYTWMETHPGASKAVAAGGALASALLLARRR